MKVMQSAQRVKTALWGGLMVVAGMAGPAEAADPAPATFKQYCFSCHGKAAMGGVNLQKLTSIPSIGTDFQHWLKVASALEAREMPPKKMPQPTDAERARAVEWIRTSLHDFAQKHAGDPGRVTVRRLTSGEYGYTIQDLTGLDLNLERDFVSDSVGGEGFTNFGDVQFMEDANLERYLETAKRIADHAVIGAGPLRFFSDPGKSGFELSAINRIQQIYTTHGFRAVAAEGGKAYGLERYGKALYAAWQFQHSEALGLGGVTLQQLAAREKISPRFIEHIWSVLEQETPSYPTSEVVSRWRKLPAPATGNETAVRAGCEDIQKFAIEWPRWLFAAGALAAGGQGDERALVLTDASLEATPKHRFRFVMRNRRSQANSKPTVHLSVSSTNPGMKEKTVVIWRNATVRVFQADRKLGPTQPLKALLSQDDIQRLAFGKLPDGGTIGPDDFATISDSPFSLELTPPEGAGGLQLLVEAEIAPGQSGDAVLRCTISDSGEASRGAPSWALLADPSSSGYKSWKKDVLEFAGNFPQTSHGEPTPSDKDPIPAPFDNTYNQPERDHYHVKLKYYRQDRFLVEKMLNDETRAQLDQAWADLLSSFEYHDEYLRFVARKYKLNLKSIDQLKPADIEAIPAEPRKFVVALKAERDAVLKAQQSAQAGHLEDCIRLAGQAWRRPLTDIEKTRLRAFYAKAKVGSDGDHSKAVRALLARILVAPAFLYRLEQPSKVAGAKPLTDWEMASRISYFLWASMPDKELRRAAAAGELKKQGQLERQVKRMLADPKARRLSTEFFGQWLGFYRFDQHRGVDATRFPEFTDEVKAAMYDEAVSFFEHIVRKDRPVREMLFADYTFLNDSLAKHYGVKKEFAKAGDMELFSDAAAQQRGGMLRLGAVLTATSAPLRTSPVKRGDWVLRRILGTPTPPPPADAGSLPADPKSFGGQTLFERLETHKRNPSCASCHVKIDPLGFPFESYDAVGRWRDQYSDGRPVHDKATLPNKTAIDGIDGLLDYLKTEEKQVLRTFSSKLLGYALGRTVQASDLPLIESMTKNGGGTPFSTMATQIVTSRQFRYRREGEERTPGTTAPHPAVQTTKSNKESTPRESGL
jgi:mono/diheme cytochrome c family protein